MIKKPKVKFLIFLLLGVAIYTNYNAPVFQQIFSHYFYRPTEAKKVEGGSGCISVNIVRTDTIFDRNQFILRGGTVALGSYEYFVDEKKYELPKRSYTGRPFSCNEIISQIFYFPIFPQWSVADNSLPEIVYWRNFLISSIALGGFIFLYALLMKKNVKN